VPLNEASPAAAAAVVFSPWVAGEREASGVATAAALRQPHDQHVIRMARVHLALIVDASDPVTGRDGTVAQVELPPVVGDPGV